MEATIGLEEAARYLGITPSTLRKRAAAGIVPAYKPGRRWMFLPSEIQQYLRASGPPLRRPIPVVALRSAVLPHDRSASQLALEIRRERLRIARSAHSGP